MQKQPVNPYARAAIMEAVENQIRDNDPPQTQQTFKRLIAAGHSEKEARRLIGCVVCAEIFDVLKSQQPFSLERFVKGLDNLPAMPWDDEEH